MLVKTILLVIQYVYCNGLCIDKRFQFIIQIQMRFQSGSILFGSYNQFILTCKILKSFTDGLQLFLIEVMMIAKSKHFDLFGQLF